MTSDELRLEIQEKSQDLKAFELARHVITKRVMELVDSKSPLTPLPEWSGTYAVLGSLDLAINAIARTVEELHIELNKTVAAEPEQETEVHVDLDPERPKLRLVKGDE